MTNLEKAIAESKAREEKATKGPWGAYTDGAVDPGYCNSRWAVGPKHVNTITKDFLKRAKDDAEFIASARTEVPMWREMVEKSAEALKSISAQGRMRGYPTAAEWIELESIAKEALTELDRLAKEGLENK